MPSKNNVCDNGRPFLEIAIFNSTSAQLAYASFADRLELCAEGSFANGGTTPSLATLQTVITSLQQIRDGNNDSTTGQRGTIPIYTMIRPRGGDFVYSDQEFDLMKEQLMALKTATFYEDAHTHTHTDGEVDDTSRFGKVDGFVFGILTKDNKIDRQRNEELVRLAAPLPCTFHRAFDEVITSSEQQRSNKDNRVNSSSDDSRDTMHSSNNNNIKETALNDEVVNELEAVINAGFASILTSGGSGRSALEGLQNIAALTRAANGRIAIIAGGGVRSANVRELRTNSPGTLFFHSSAIVGNENIASRDEVEALKRELIVPL